MRAEIKELFFWVTANEGCVELPGIILPQQRVMYGDSPRFMRAEYGMEVARQMKDLGFKFRLVRFVRAEAVEVEDTPEACAEEMEVRLK